MSMIVDMSLKRERIHYICFTAAIKRLYKKKSKLSTNRFCPIGWGSRIYQLLF